MAHTVVRLDNLDGQDVHAVMRSVRMYDSNNKTIDVDNGVIAELSGLETGKREVYKGTFATSDSDLAKCVLIATPEVMYDERKKSLDEFFNPAGLAARGYILRAGNIYSVTKEGFTTGSGTTPVVPEKDAEVGIGTGGKLDASGTGFGTCIDINVVGSYTYYAIEVGRVAGEDSGSEDSGNED